ncbi:hypothetical protein [Bordetella bronchiseptica]|uniref:hypothetical protein n=1 Tax=Bordetella bronchiseptica TaxID=518 RepID=UPI00123C3F70|nr:hypothetical protein [Bordetella bronchiseptica]QET71816.1 hypothetical protein FOB42_16505 [Bordetella bronchiseptica]
MSIASCVTWECVNSFANWLSAIGTICTAGLALWLSVRDRRINLKAALTLGLLPSSKQDILDLQVFVLSFTNVGPRPVTITNHCWELPFINGIIFLQPYMDRDIGKFCSKLPLELTDGKEGHAFYSNDFFLNLDAPEKFLFHKNRFVAWLRIRFFKIRIVTTAGARPRVKIARAVRQRLWQQYIGT